MQEKKNTVEVDCKPDVTTLGTRVYWTARLWSTLKEGSNKDPWDDLQPADNEKKVSGWVIKESYPGLASVVIFVRSTIFNLMESNVGHF